MHGALIGILKETDKHALTSLLDSIDRIVREIELVIEVGGDVADEALKGCLGQHVRRLLLQSLHLAQDDHAWLVAFLDATHFLRGRDSLLLHVLLLADRLAACVLGNLQGLDLVLGLLASCNFGLCHLERSS